MNSDFQTQATIQIQNILLALSRSDSSIPRVNVDGIYGPETSAAVKAFQRQHGLPVTGEVNYATWLALLKAMEDNNAVSLPSKPVFPFSFVLEGNNLSPGDSSTAVFILQVMLETAGIEYLSLSSVPLSGIYDEETECAVREFQKRNLLPETGIADTRTLSALADSFNKYAPDSQ